jgi:Pyruvate/2-oxoacid:ferredoxin oxidoreductase gamma subunit
MPAAKSLIISNPGIGGSGYLTVAAMQADAAIIGGFHATMHVCRGLAQAGGPLCVDVVMQSDEIYGAGPPGVDYINSSDLTEAWRVLTTPQDFSRAFPRGVTVVSDYFVELPILVASSRKGPRYYTREQFIHKFQELMEQGKDLRVITYDFAQNKFPAILRGPFSIGVLVADLEERQKDLLKITREAKGGVLAVSQRQKFNVHVFNCGYEARKSYLGPKDQRLILLHEQPI